MSESSTTLRTPAPRDPIFGSVGLRTEMRANGVKGNLLGARAWYVKQHFGPGAFDKVARALPPSARELFEGAPLPFAWCSFGDMMDIDRAIVEGPMKGDVTLMKPFGSAIAKHDLPTLYKVLFKVGSPEFVMCRIGIAAATYVRDSPMKGSSSHKGRASVVQTGCVFPLYFCKYGVAGWFQAAVELSGGKKVDVEHTQCRHDGDRDCQWELRWS
jgi:hypothetical protein